MRYLLPIVFLLVSCREESTPVQEGGLDSEGAPVAYVHPGLPKGISDIESIDVEVRGNVTHYKYAFITDTSTTCEEAEYGEWYPVATRLQLDLGEHGHKIICLIGKDSEGNEQEEAKRYQWMKASAAVEVSEDKRLPVAVVDGGMEAAYAESAIELNILGDYGATKYQYVLVKEENFDCNSLSDDNYGEEKNIGDKLKLNIKTGGEYTLCLRGRNTEDIQAETSVYSFEKKVQASTELTGELYVTKTGEAFFTSAAKYTRTLKLENKSKEGGLEWKIAAEEKIDWLQVKETGGEYTAVTAGDVIGGTLAAGETTTVSLRLADVYKTDYGKPYERISELEVINVSKSKKVKVETRLYIPAVKVSRSQTIPEKVERFLSLYLSDSNTEEKLYFLNAGEGGHGRVSYQTIPIFIAKKNDAGTMVYLYRHHEKAKAAYEEFKSIVSVKAQKDEDYRRFLKFSVNKDELARKPSNYGFKVSFAIVSNTDRKDYWVQPLCGLAYGKSYEGGKEYDLGLRLFTPWVTTNTCHFIDVYVQKLETGG